MRVFLDEDNGQPAVDITTTGEGCQIVDYVRGARTQGIPDDEIEEDIGGGERDLDGGGKFVFDGMVKWACGAVFDDDGNLCIFGSGSGDFDVAAFHAAYS